MRGKISRINDDPLRVLLKAKDLKIKKAIVFSMQNIERPEI